MTNRIRLAVLRGETVDTKKYRYILRECRDATREWAEIQRLPLVDPDTTAAIDGWETVETYA